jgi:hypothetical protein
MLGLIFSIPLLWKKLAPESQIVLYEKTVRIRWRDGQGGNEQVCLKDMGLAVFSR